MDDLRIYTKISSLYQVFDASGHLPFSVVFGLCRRSSRDTDPRPVILDIPGSVLDVPYALTHGLLTLHEASLEDSSEKGEIDLSQIPKAPAKKEGHLPIPSPVNRTEHWRDAVTVYHCQLDTTGILAGVLEPGKRYIIRLASANLGVRKWKYSSHTEYNEGNKEPDSHHETTNLLNSKPTAGIAKFKFVASLPWPPSIETTMRLCASSDFSDAQPSDINRKRISTLEISVVNTSSKPVTIQTQGRQRFLIPWGPFQPLFDADDRMRIIDSTTVEPPTSSLHIIDSVEGKVVRESRQSKTAVLTAGSPDPRPRLSSVRTLSPQTPIIMEIDIGTLVDGLADGQYRIQMQPKGCRWWHGEISQEEGEDGRVPADLCEVLPPPLRLESRDKVDILIRDGKVE